LHCDGPSCPTSECQCCTGWRRYGAGKRASERLSPRGVEVITLGVKQSRPQSLLRAWDTFIPSHPQLCFGSSASQQLTVPHRVPAVFLSPPSPSRPSPYAAASRSRSRSLSRTHWASLELVFDGLTTVSRRITLAPERHATRLRSTSTTGTSLTHIMMLSDRSVAIVNKAASSKETRSSFCARNKLISPNLHSASRTTVSVATTAIMKLYCF